MTSGLKVRNSTHNNHQNHHDKKTTTSSSTTTTPTVARAKSSTTSVRIKRLYLARPDVLHQYLRHQYINQYLDYVEQRYPTFVKVYKLGNSYEGRDLKAIEIDWFNDRNQTDENCITKHFSYLRTKSAPINSKTTTATSATTTNTPPSNNATSTTKSMSETTSKSTSTLPTSKNNKRNMIFIEGGTHAREWLTISVALSFIYQLTERHIRNREILNKFRFFIVPITNPDGYEYTINKNVRWRKNRRPTSPSCTNFGIDCNRNYDFHWDKGSNKATRNTYKGEKPFSEPETRALGTTLLNLAPNILVFISLHSYAQSIMYPWGYTRDSPDNINELQAVASAGRYAIKAYSGRNYRTGSIAKFSSQIIGGSIVDYAYGVIKVPFAFVMELPDSSYGFQPPPEVIRPIGQESWIGIREMCYCAHTLYKNRPPRASISQEMRKKYSPPIMLAKQLLHGTEAYKCMHTAG